jgi:hypothetical protein
MALNVWLTFYRKYDAERIRRLELFYFLACYGIPFVPGFVYVFIQTPEKGRFYGNAVLWCWVSSEWDIFRLATFYAPVWYVQIMSARYPLLTSNRIVIGLTMAIYVRAGKDIYANRKRLLRISNEHSASHISTVDNPFQASKTTEISFVSESVDKHRDGGNFEMGMPDSRPSPITKSPYSVTVSGPDPMLRLDVENGLANSDNMEMSPTVRFPGHDTQRPNPPPTHRAVTQTDNANWAYAKVAALFFVALMVTWIPSSANRVYSYVHPGDISLGLELASAFVLPLQGFWNALIYATTSLPACKTFVNEVKGHMKFRGNTLRRVSGAFPSTNESQHGPSSSRSGMFTEIDSITSVDSRPSKC